MHRSQLTFEQSLKYRYKFDVYLYEDGGVWFVAGLETDKRDIFMLDNVDSVDVLETISKMDVPLTAMVSTIQYEDYFREHLQVCTKGCMPFSNVADRQFWTFANFSIMDI